MTTTDDDLRDLLWRMGNSPGEIEAHMANPLTRAYLRMFIDEFNRRAAELIARRIAEKLFPEYLEKPTSSSVAVLTGSASVCRIISLTAGYHMREVMTSIAWNDLAVRRSLTLFTSKII